MRGQTGQERLTGSAPHSASIAAKALLMCVLVLPYETSSRIRYIAPLMVAIHLSPLLPSPLDLLSSKRVY